MSEIKRLDIWLMEQRQISRNQAQIWIAAGYVSGGNSKLKAALKLTAEEFARLTVNPPSLKKTKAEPEDIPLKIIYEDNDLIVVHKPVGLVVHPACGNYSGTLVNALLHHCRKLSGIGGIERPGIVHRLDKDTEGLLVVALNDKAHRSLSKQFEKHTITRKYLALVKGNLPQDQATIRGNLARSRQNRKKVAVVSGQGKKAVTHYTVLKRFNSATLAEVSLETGRTHQIRVHFAYIGHPLLGDPVYNPDYNNKNTVQRLIAYKLGFIQPQTKKYLEFTAELPEWAKNYY